MKHGISASFKDKFISNLFRIVYKTLPMGSFCERLAAPLVVRHKDWKDKRFTVPLKIVHLTDLHFDPQAGVGQNSIQAVINLTRELNPDLILITGDFIVDICKHPTEYGLQLKQFTDLCPVYATLGNHDGGVWAGTNQGYPNLEVIRAILTQAEIELLYNENRTLNLKGTPIQLVGLADLWAGDFHPETAFAGADTTIPTILLSHNPDTLPFLKPFAWDIMLSGHTHGGQVVLPIIGAPWTPIDDKRLAYGEVVVDSRRTVFISAGTGGVFQLRYRRPAEILSFNLKTP